MSSEERGAGLVGAFTGYVIILVISIWLLKSANKKEKDNREKIKTSFFDKKNSLKKSTNQLSLEEQKQSIEILKDKGVLNETEYLEKINLIDEQIITERAQKSTEYQNLLKVYESDLLTKEQFHEKIAKLIAEYKDYFSIFGENNYPEFTWELYRAMKINLRRDTSEYMNTDLYGKWKFKNGQVFFYRDEKTSKKKIKITWNSGLNRYGEWELKDNQLNLKLQKSFGYDKEILHIEELGSDILIYYINEEKYTCLKDVSENKNV